MNGKPEIISMLNQLLSGGLAALNQHLVHATITASSGYQGLGDRMRSEVDEEIVELTTVLERILYPGARG